MNTNSYLASLAKTDPEFVERFGNFAYGEVPEQLELDAETQYLGWLATLLGSGARDLFEELLPEALDGALKPIQVKEVVYQAVAYLGMGRVFPFVNATNKVLANRGIRLPLEAQAQTELSEKSRLEGGENAQVAIFGEGFYDFKAKGNPSHPWINKWLVDNCFGDWYTRGGLDLKQRELITFCFIAAQGGCEPQLRGHAAGNVSVGNSKELLIKVVSSNLPFIGYPRTLNTLRVLDEINLEKG